MTDGGDVAGCRIELRPTSSQPRIASIDGLATLPTLGEIVDKLRTEYPDRMWPCDPALRDVRISSVVVEVR